MSDKIVINFENADEVIRKLKKLSDVDTEQVLRKATAYCHGQAKDLCPVGKTGALRESIHMQFIKKGRQSGGKVYTNMEYASYVEFGTGINGNGSYPHANKLPGGMNLTYRDTPWVYPVDTDDGKEFRYTKGQVAQPYMYPALADSEEYMLELMGEDLKKQIHKKIK